MKRVMLAVALAPWVATPAAAQWAGMPVWNNPKGGTGVTISGDFASNNDDAGGGSAFGARGTAGIGTLSLTAGLASWKPDGFDERTLSYGATAGFRVIGGSLLPVSLNLQLGAGSAGEITAGTTTVPKTTMITAGAGISASVPTPGLSIEPYVSLTNRWHKQSGVSGTESNIGYTIGASMAFGMLGLHFAYDSEKRDGRGTSGIFGIGAHVALKAPIGM
ncbi:MAG: hypothetical protein ACREL9_09800 [Gemmatimonadales bacterium]